MLFELDVTLWRGRYPCRAGCRARSTAKSSTRKKSASAGIWKKMRLTKPAGLVHAA